MVTATIVALQRLQSDPLTQLMRAMPATPVGEWITNSPVVTGLAAEMPGHDNPDPLAAQFLIRVFPALWCSPLKDTADQRSVVERVLGDRFAVGGH